VTRRTSRIARWHAGTLARWHAGTGVSRDTGVSRIRTRCPARTRACHARRAAHARAAPRTYAHMTRVSCAGARYAGAYHARRAARARARPARRAGFLISLFCDLALKFGLDSISPRFGASGASTPVLGSLFTDRVSEVEQYQHVTAQRPTAAPLPEGTRGRVGASRCRVRFSPPTCVHVHVHVRACAYMKGDIYTRHPDT